VSVPRTDVELIVRAGQHAPSGDNCQPWRFEWDEDSLGIVFVSERADSLYDVEQTASWVALGAVLTNMRVAATRVGLGLSVELFPRNAPQALAARVRFHAVTRDDDPLLPAIEQRCVNRRPYRAEPLHAHLRQELLAVASGEAHVRLDLVESEPLKSKLAALAASQDRILFENRLLHDGLYRWLRWSPQEIADTQDGMPVETLELAPCERTGFRLLRFWGWASFLARLGATQFLPLRAEHCYRHSAAIGLVSTQEPRPDDWVRAGEIFERLWLTATLRGLSLQPITGITFLWLRMRLADGEGLSPTHQRLIERLAQEIGAILPAFLQQTPVVLFRLGKAQAPSQRAMRRPLDEVLTLRECWRA